MRATRAAAGAVLDGQVHRVAILGGGIAGLASCHYVQGRLAQERKQNGAVGPGRVALIERGPRLGGWMHSLRSPEGFVFEAGPSRYDINRAEDFYNSIIFFLQN